MEEDTIGSPGSTNADVNLSTAMESSPSSNGRDGAVRREGISVFLAAMFVSGELAGTGLLALPQAVGQSGWIGIPLIVIFGMVSGYNGMNLGRCWTMLLERYPEMSDGKERRPYPALGQKAFGAWMRIPILVSIQVNLFGSSAVFLLLASENVQSILQVHAGINISFCYWLLLVTAVLLPLAWLGTPKDFWPIGVGATGATLLAAVVVTVSTAMDIPNQEDVPHENPTFYSFMLAFGTIIFSFGGSGTFPTIQQDMKKPQKFPLTVLISYLCVLSMYLPVTISGYMAYGSGVNGNVLLSLPNGALRVTAEILILLHVMCAFVINLNPFSLDMEELFHIPHSFNWKRCLLRTCIVVAALFVAETVPRFDAVLNLLGASATSFLTFVAPSMLYLHYMEAKHGKGSVPLHIRVVNYEIIFIGIVGGIVGTVIAVMDIVGSVNFVPPCYVNVTAANLANQV